MKKGICSLLLVIAIGLCLTILISSTFSVETINIKNSIQPSLMTESLKSIL